MASLFLHHVVGDLTVGKPELVEFLETETVAAAMEAIKNGGEAEGAIAVWRKKEERMEFVGMVSAMGLVGFVARRGGDAEEAMRASVAEVVVENGGLLKEVDPGTRLIDALEMMKQGVRRLLVRKSVVWKGFSKRFSILYHGKWLRNMGSAAGRLSINDGQPSASALPHKYCCLTCEDVVRFLIGFLGALAPLPLSSISSLGAITPNYSYVEASSPAIEAIFRVPQDPCAVAVVETNSDGAHKIIGEISSYKLQKCDYLAAAWAMVNLSAEQFVNGPDDDNVAPVSELDNIINSAENTSTRSPRPNKFSSRRIGFFSNPLKQMSMGRLRGVYGGRSLPLTCKHTSSLAAVMAQLLSHRATHVWVTDANSDDDILLGIVSYTDILNAVTKNTSHMVSATL